MYFGAPHVCALQMTVCPAAFTYGRRVVTVLDSPRMSEYRTMRKGICRRLGRQAPNGLVPFSL